MRELRRSPGFPHSIADEFYFMLAPADTIFSPSLLIIYIGEVAGNFVGCNLYRVVMKTSRTQ